MYGGGFDLLAAAAAKVLPFGLFETRRLIGAAVGLVGLIATWRVARRLGGPAAGLIALVLLASCPLYVGHTMMNAKDAPFAVAMAILLLGLVRAFEEYPRPRAATIAVAGVGFGLALGSRILGGLGALYALFGLVFTVAAEARAKDCRYAAGRAWHFTARMLLLLVLAAPVMAFVWPWAVSHPLNPLRALQYFSHFFEQPWHELFGGQLIVVTEMPLSYLPTLFALQPPEIFVLLAMGGIAATGAMVFRRDIAVNRRATCLLVLLAALLPIAIGMLTHPALYNGIRHFLFVLPPLAVLGGLAGAWLFDVLRERSRAIAAAAALVFAAGVSLPFGEMIRLHPLEYTYYNLLAGGVAGARKNYMLDYWGLSFKEASRGLLAALAERHEAAPAGRRWKLAVCGPHRSPQVELGPSFETTWDPHGADFAMMLGEFYCRTFDAPLLAEVVRDGVVYARVYDIRGRSYDSLLTLPEP
jgi:4-amino-4-deoxy-L-arabinose transferase-like glycosyltransferase